MFSEEVRKMLVQVISSWQVLVVTVVLILYVFLINYVARIYHRPGRSGGLFLPRTKRESSSNASTIVPSESDELGLEEESPPRKK